MIKVWFLGFAGISSQHSADDFSLFDECVSAMVIVSSWSLQDERSAGTR